MIYELSLAALFMLLIGLAFAGNQLQATAPESDPVSYVSETVNQGWLLLNQFHIAQQVMIFLMWAVFGMLVYVVLFRIFQLIYGTVYQLIKGVEYVHKEHAQGAVKWLGSLQEIVLKTVIWITGSFAMFIGIVVGFSYARTLLRVAVSESLPDNLVYFAGAFLATFISLRLVMVGLCFLLPSFRRWYAV